MAGFAQDFSYALRLIRRRPAMTAAAVLTFALGIGANTAIFSVVNAVLLKPLPYPSSDRLVFVSLDINTGFGARTSLPVADFLAWRSANRACAQIAAYTDSGPVAVSVGSEAESVVATTATAHFFEALGVDATIGRVWHEGDDDPGRPATVIVSHSYWSRTLHRDPQAIGQTLRIEGQAFTIIGVTPPGFSFPSTRTELWTIMGVRPPTRRGPFFLRGLGLMKSGATVEEVRTDLRLASEDLNRQFPSRRVPTYRVEYLKDVITGDARPALVLLSIAVALVLLVAIVNVANLLLASAAVREREMAVRAALGASRLRIVRQLFTEAIVLVAAGTAAGWALAIWATRVLVLAAPSSLPRVGEIRMDLPVFVFTLATAGISAIAFAMAPAAHFMADPSGETMSGSSRTVGSARTRRLRNLFVVAEVAFALMLAFGAVLLARSLIRLERVDMGFNPEHLLTASVSAPRSRYPDDGRVVALFDDWLRRVRSLPGVVGAAVSNSLPPDGLSVTDSFVVEERLPALDRGASVGPILSISEDYFRVLGTRLLDGRSFAETDAAASSRVAIVSASLVRRHFGDLDPIGRRIKQVADWPKPDSNPWLTIIGVVDDVKYAGLGEVTGPALYIPLRQVPFRNQNIIVRVGGDSVSLVSGVRAALHAVDPDLPLADVRTMDDRIRDAAGEPRFRTWLMGLFGVTGLALSAIGIFGALSLWVAQRTREIGVRAALGATRQELVGMVFRESLRLCATGVAAGVVLALSGSRFLTSVLFDVHATDPVALLASGGALLSLALVAAWLPARRAACVDPSIALRSE